MNKNRRDFIKASSILGAASLLPIGKLLANSSSLLSNREEVSGTCVLIPTEVAGPFPLDLTANTTFFRQDIREDKEGVPMKLKLKILGNGNCLPMQNVRVNVWHCDKDGVYSGYDTTNNPGQAGLTYFRGYQMTDANGEVEFMTIFPGWYNGRICHIHFQVYVSSSYAAISQLTFDVATKQAIYTANPDLYTNGTDPMSLASDNIFSDGYQYQIATLTENTDINGYDAYLEVTIEGNGTVGIGHSEKENAKNFTMGQNYPNPFEEETTIPVTLNQTSDVVVDLYNLQGKKVLSINKPNLSVGSHSININLAELSLAGSSYLYQMTVKNSAGTYVDSKLMTSK